MSVTLSGNGNGTGPGQVVWFCHCCGSLFVLAYGEYHQCKPSASGESP